MNLMMISKHSVSDIGNTQQPFKAYGIAPPLLAPEDQRRPRGLQWGTFDVKILKMLDLFALASICQLANSGIILPIRKFEKANYNSEAFKSQDFVQTGWEDQDACLKMSVSKPFPPCIPKLPKNSLLALHVKEEYSASFQLSVGLCFRRLLTQRGRSPSLIFCLEISTCSRCKKGFMFPLGEMPS